MKANMARARKMVTKTTVLTLLAAAVWCSAADLPPLRAPATPLCELPCGAPSVIRGRCCWCCVLLVLLVLLLLLREPADR